MKNKKSFIAENRKARHDYTLNATLQAGIQLEGWEVKSVRAGKVQLSDSYVFIKNDEAYLFGALIQPMLSASTHVSADPTRTRKLLLKKSEIENLKSAVEQKGYTCVALGLEWDRHLVKCVVALAKGKQNHDKREAERKKDAQRELHQASKQTRHA